MNTELLIAHLSRDLPPVQIGVSRRLLGKGLLAGASLAMAGLIFSPSLGFRPDLGPAMLTGIFWVKLLYTGSLVLLGFHALGRLSRPGTALVRWRRLVLLPLGALALFAAFGFGSTPATSVDGFWMGSTWLQCSLYTALLSVPIFVALLWSLSHLAPTRLTEAGAVAGLVAGATGATIYGLHCTESSAGFVLLWYSVGPAISCLVGAAIGARLLRW